jgi:hypothetical protein
MKRSRTIRLALESLGDNFIKDHHDVSECQEEQNNSNKKRRFPIQIIPPYASLDLNPVIPFPFQIKDIGLSLDDEVM